MILKKVKASQRRRRLRILTSSSKEILLHISRDLKTVIKHTQFLKQTIQLHDSLNDLSTKHMKSFLKRIMIETHNQKLLTRDLHEMQKITAARLKRDSLS